MEAELSNPLVQEIIDVAELRRDVFHILKTLDEINLKLENKYVTHDEFEPIKRLVNGLVGVVLGSVVLGIVALILKTR